ncbi:MAG: hypothetical protein Q8O12_00660 [Candidatus Omnitrophota bacterium]|nr:hypothetical protein [Candidatus Omnitrophota bacterium]
MIKNILILLFFCASFSGTGFCLEEIEIDSEVIAVNAEKEYLIIKAGEKDGVEIGDGLIVHRDGEKLAEAQVIEVRANVSAAEILRADKLIKEGDRILIVKKSEKRVAGKKRDTYQASYQPQKKSKWASILGPGAQAASVAPVETVTQGQEYGVETLETGSVQVAQEGSVVRADINADLNTVFSYALMALRENGYSVILTNRAIGVITATKPIELSIIGELFADATAVVGHKTVLSLQMEENSSSTELDLSSFNEHTQKGKQIKFPVTRGSNYYNDMVKVASKIKERAER